MQQKDFNSFELFCEYFNIRSILNTKNFTEAITHASYCKKYNYERMEFLGDTILNFCISKMIFNEFPDGNEGFLSKKKSFLCSRKICSEIASNIHLDEKIIYSKKSNVDINSIKGNVLESLLCCIYFAYDIEKVYQIVCFLFSPFLYTTDITNSKMLLQETMQKTHKILPEYITLSKEGTDNHPIFTVKVVCNNLETYGTGTSKKDAEKNAALNMLKLLNTNKKRNNKQNKK